MATSVNYYKKDELLEQRIRTIRTLLIDFICSFNNKETENQNNIQLINDTLDDEIIINYVVTVLEDSLIDEKNDDKIILLDSNNFQIDEFCEMMCAYFPQYFKTIPKESVLQFVNNLLETLRNQINCQPNSMETVNQSEDKTILVFNNLLEECCKNISPKDTEDDDDLLFSFESISLNQPPPPPTINQDSTLLLEMFPNLSKSDAVSILSLSNGNIERAVQIILLDNTTPSSPEPSDNFCGNVVKSNHQINSKINSGGKKLDEKTLKKRVVERYGFIDKAQDQKEFKPILPKEEPKKLVRYREGQVVSTKGERFTEVAVNKDGEETKIRTYICKTHRQLQQNH